MPAKFRLTHIPVDALALITEWLSGHCIARLWFTGDSMLHTQFSRGGVRRIEVKVRGAYDSTIRVPLLSELSNLDTLIVSPRSTTVLQFKHAVFDLSVVPKSLRWLRIRIPISVRTFSKTPTGRVEYYDWKEIMPNLIGLDLTEAELCLYEEMGPLMPQGLRHLHFSSNGTVDQALLDALPLNNLEELTVRNNGRSAPRMPAEESITLPSELKKVVWTHPWQSLKSLPPTISELVLGMPYSFNGNRQYYLDSMPTHTLPLWRRIAATESLKSLEVHLNHVVIVSFGAGIPYVMDPPQFFSVLPKNLTSLVINYSPWKSDLEARLITMDCVTALPSTLLHLTLAGFDFPLSLLTLLPCDNLKTLEIYERAQPGSMGEGDQVTPGDRYRVGRRRIPTEFYNPRDHRYNNSISIGEALYNLYFPCTQAAGKQAAVAAPSAEVIFLLLGASPDEQGITPEEAQTRRDHRKLLSELTPDIVSQLPRSLAVLHLPQADLHLLETLGPHSWPPALGIVSCGKVPLSYISQIPRSVFDLDCEFVHSKRSAAKSSEPVGVETQLLPPLLYRLRCSLPSISDLNTSLVLPNSIAKLDIAFQDVEAPSSFSQGWSDFLPPHLLSLSVFGVGTLFSELWLDHLPAETLRDLEIDVQALGPETGRNKRQSPFTSWKSLPRNLTNFTLRINTLLNFNIVKDLPTTLENLTLKCSGTTCVYSIEHPEWIPSLPPRLRNMTLPLKAAKQKSIVPNLLAEHAIDLNWFEEKTA